VIKYFSIAELKISLEYDNECYSVLLNRVLEAFASNPFETSDIHFRIDTESPFPSFDSYKKIFTTNPEGLWTMLEDRAKSHYLVSLQYVESEKEPYKIARADRSFSDVIIYSRPTKDNLLSPLDYPLDELVLSAHININKIGIILHSACISTGGRGFLFSGVSGSGKSTISEIWQKDEKTTVLTDERVIIREKDGDLWAFGSPWHGTAEIHKNMGAPIEKIFFIKHGKVNRAIPISKTDAARRLMVRCFPTFWNREGMEFVLDFCTRVAGGKECYELEFVNDLSVARYVKNLKH
jgi:hypothetical protein